MGGTKIFLADGTLPALCTSKILDPKVLCGVGEKCLKFLPFSKVKCAVEQISETVCDINPLFVPDC